MLAELRKWRITLVRFSTVSYKNELSVSRNLMDAGLTNTQTNDSDCLGIEKVLGCTYVLHNKVNLKWRSAQNLHMYLHFLRLVFRKRALMYVSRLGIHVQHWHCPISFVSFIWMRGEELAVRKQTAVFCYYSCDLLRVQSKKKNLKVIQYFFFAI